MSNKGVLHTHHAHVRGPSTALDYIGEERGAWIAWKVGSFPVLLLLFNPSKMGLPYSLLALIC